MYGIYIIRTLYIYISDGWLMLVEICSRMFEFDSSEHADVAEFSSWIGVPWLRSGTQGLVKISSGLGSDKNTELHMASFKSTTHQQVIAIWVRYCAAQPDEGSFSSLKILLRSIRPWAADPLGYGFSNGKPSRNSSMIFQANLRFVRGPAHHLWWPDLCFRLHTGRPYPANAFLPLLTRRPKALKASLAQHFPWFTLDHPRNRTWFLPRIVHPAVNGPQYI